MEQKSAGNTHPHGALMDVPLRPAISVMCLLCPRDIASSNPPALPLPLSLARLNPLRRGREHGTSMCCASYPSMLPSPPLSYLPPSLPLPLFLTRLKPAHGGSAVSVDSSKRDHEREVRSSTCAAQRRERKHLRIRQGCNDHHAAKRWICPTTCNCHMSTCKK